MGLVGHKAWETGTGFLVGHQSACAELGVLSCGLEILMVLLQVVCQGAGSPEIAGDYC